MSFKCDYILEDDHLGIWANKAFQLLHIQLPFAFLLKVPQTHISTETRRYRIELLIRRMDTDNMISLSC